MSTVSVIVPCYNYGRFLPHCVESVLSQEGVDVEVLIIDDASPDGSAEVARALGRDPRVQVVCHDPNHGHIATYNEGLAWASGDYLLLLSADDYLTPGSLARAAALMDAHPEVGLVYGRAVLHRSEAPYAGPLSTGAGRRVVPGRRWIEERCRRMDNVVSTPTAVVRTRVQHEVGGYREDSPYAGDLEMWLRLAAYADVGEIEADQAIYRQHGQNMSVESHSALKVTFEHSRHAYETVLREHAAAIPAAGRLRRVVRREVARRALRMATNRYCRGRVDPGVAWLESHAGEVYPRRRLLPEWWALQACKGVGPRAAAHMGPAVDSLRARLDLRSRTS
ncbi:MAG TPA: glycosyltransferase [Solirubrobacteraceae bacterium]|jgi:glycosyltransferase involved in cell wall biosynthesis|nr:glycosyltransferase [Solirubrobacteraceae bacterium]